MRERFPAVYIVASRRKGTLYIGVTSVLPGRIWQHREGTIPGFSKLYGCKLLVWFEAHDTMDLAIVREKQLKEWRRGWKLKLIEAGNPEWEDLFSTLF